MATLGGTMAGANLTINKLAIYRRFDGDIDGWQRCKGSQDEISDEDWSTIDDLRQSLFLVKSGKASKRFSEQLEADLRIFVADEKTYCELISIVESDMKKLAFTIKVTI
jgi:hypothetical protein